MVVVGVQGDLGEEKRAVWFMWEDRDDVAVSEAHPILPG